MSSLMGSVTTCYIIHSIGFDITFVLFITTYVLIIVHDSDDKIQD